MDNNEDRKIAREIYPKIVSLIKEKGEKHDKKHGNFFIVQKQNEYLALDTWNGYISIIRGKFDGKDTFHRGIGIAAGKDIVSRLSMGIAYQFIMFEN